MEFDFTPDNTKDCILETEGRLRDIIDSVDYCYVLYLMKATQTKNGVHVEEINIAITFDKVLTDTCRIKGHSYETIDYIPDFDGQRYKLLIQCTDCGLETFEKINKDEDVCGDEYEYPPTSTLERYWKKADEVSHLIINQAFATEGIV